MSITVIWVLLGVMALVTSIFMGIKLASEDAESDDPNELVAFLVGVIAGPLAFAITAAFFAFNVYMAIKFMQHYGIL